jgi:hypothetical protein
LASASSAREGEARARERNPATIRVGSLSERFCAAK